MMRLSITCPLCGEAIAIDAPEPENDLGRIAINHGNHIVLVEYDKKGDLRTVETFRVIKGEDFIVSCPECGKKEGIPRVEKEILKVAFPHNDHAMLVYMIGKRLVAETVKMVVPVSVEVTENIIARIAGIIGFDALASILLEPIVEGSRMVYVPYNLVEEFEFLFQKVKPLQRILIVPGTISKLEVRKEYVIRHLTDLARLPENEAILRLDRLLSMLESIIERGLQRFKENPFFLIQVVREIGNKELAALVLDALRIRYGITPPPGLRI